MEQTRKPSKPFTERLHINRNQLLARAEVAYEVGITSIEHRQQYHKHGSETTFWAQIEVIDGKEDLLNVSRVDQGRVELPWDGSDASEWDHTD